MNRIKKILFFLFFVGIFLWLPGAYKRVAHPFRLSKCQIEWPHNPAWELNEAPKPEIAAVFEKPFTYLAKGKQSYVFLSSDGKFVLKLFRFDQCKIPLGKIIKQKAEVFLGRRPKAVPMPLSERAYRTFQSCFLSHVLAPLQTGVIWVHLNPQEGKLPRFVVKDKMGRGHAIDPRSFRFVLQKRAVPFTSALLQGSEESRKVWIRSFIVMLEELRALGLSNHDGKIGQNFGLLEGRAVTIDIGNFFQPEELPPDEIPNYLQALRLWLAEKLPEHVADLEKI